MERNGGEYRRIRTRTGGGNKARGFAVAAPENRCRVFDGSGGYGERVAVTLEPVHSALGQARLLLRPGLPTGPYFPAITAIHGSERQSGE